MNYLILASSQKGDFMKESYYYVEENNLGNALAAASKAYATKNDVEAFQIELVTTNVHLLRPAMPHSITAQLEK